MLLLKINDGFHFSSQLQPDIERPVEYTVSHHRPQHQPPQQYGRGAGYREEYVELHSKRESDI